MAEFNVNSYLAANPDVAEHFNTNPNAKTAYGTIENWATAHYQNIGQKEGRSLGGTPTSSNTTPTTPISGLTGPMQVTATGAQGSNQINIADYAGQLVGDPSAFFLKDNPATPKNESMSLSDQNKTANYGTAAQVDGTKAAFQGDPKAIQAATATGTAATAGSVDPRQAATYEAKTSQSEVEKAAMEAAKGTVSDKAIIDPSKIEIDVDAIAKGQTETGKALNQYASQNISNVIDTSTIAGRMLAEQLGEGNYLDSKATLKGQLDILSKEFVDEATGEPRIPTWAAGTARNVAKIAAFGGMTGTAATSAMAQAIMEASIPVAQADSQFYQTVTIQNLNNKQAATINRAQVLAKMDLANMDTRLAVAVQNAKNFMDMDLANLNNEQQARVINTQARVQSILEDAKAVNAQRLFTAESTNDMNKFYDQLNASIEQFNTSQKNSMTQFNTEQTNNQGRFNAELENNRQQFYSTMQYNIDVSNAKWRQEVTLQSNQQIFDAATLDVKNMVGISSEQLSQLWDRSDALLDYLWKSSESESDRKTQLAIAKLQAQTTLDKAGMDAKAADNAGIGSIVGSVVAAGATSFFKDFDWSF